MRKLLIGAAVVFCAIINMRQVYAEPATKQVQVHARICEIGSTISGECIMRETGVLMTWSQTSAQVYSQPRLSWTERPFILPRQDHMYPLPYDLYFLRSGQ